jgi:hypothetical protein
VTVQLGRILFHHLFRALYAVFVVKLGPFLVGLLLRGLLDKEVFDRSSTCRSLVDRKCRSELSVCAYLYCIQQ